MIKIENLKKSYTDKEIFNNFSYTFEDKKKYILKGQNGQGKTTLINMITLLDLKYEGKIYIDGLLTKDIDDKETFRYNYFGYADQENDLLEQLTIKENFKIFLKKYDEKKLEKLLLGLNLSNLINHKYKYLSGGEKQKVKIIIALLKKSKIIILDEPTNNLDKRSNQFLYEYVDKISDKLVIIVDHLYGKNELKSSHQILNLTEETKDLNLNKDFDISQKEIKNKEIKNDKFKLSFKESIKLVQKYFFTNITVYIFLIVAFVILINSISSAFLATQNFNDYKNNQFDSKTAIISTTRDNEYCMNYFNECTEENFRFSEKQIETLKENENVKYVNSYNILMNTEPLFKVKDTNTSIDEYFKINTLDLNLIDSYNLIQKDTKELSRNSQINVKNMNLVNPQKEVKNTSYTLKQYNYKQMTYGEIPGDNNSNEVMIDENLAAYIAKEKNLNSIESLLNQEIKIPTKKLIYNEELKTYEVDPETFDKTTIKITGIYEPIEALTSNIIYGYNKDYDSKNLVEQNIIPLDDINTKRSVPLTQEKYNELIKGDINNIYVEFKSSEDAENYTSNFKLKYPYLTIYSQEEFQNSEEFKGNKNGYQQIIRKNLITVVLLIIFGIFIFIGQRKINLKQKKILTSYGMNKRNFKVMKLYQKIVVFGCILLIGSIFLTNILIVNIIAIVCLLVLLVLL